MDGLNTNLAGASLTQTTLIFLTVMPPALALRNGSGVEFQDDVKAAQLTAATISVAVGVGLSVIASDWRPFAIALVASGAMFAATSALANMNPVK